MTSDNINLLGVGSFTVSFWYMDDDLDGGTDFELYYYDGSTYDLITQALNPVNEDQWYQYTQTVTDSQYFISNFRVRFSATPESNENAFIDDVLVTYASSYTGSASKTFDFTGSATRAVEVNRGVSKSFDFTGSASRLIEFFRAASRSFTVAFSTLAEKASGFIANVALSLAFNGDVGRVFEAERGVSQTLTVSTLTATMNEYYRSATQGITFTGLTSRLGEYSRDTVQTITFMFQGLGEKISEYTRDVSLTLKFLGYGDDPSLSVMSWWPVIVGASLLFFFLIGRRNR